MMKQASLPWTGAKRPSARPCPGRRKEERNTCAVQPDMVQKQRCWQNPAAGFDSPIPVADTPPHIARRFFVALFMGAVYPEHSCFHCTFYGAVMREASCLPVP